VVSLLGHPNENVNEVAAAIIARSCDEDNGERRDLYWHQGAMGPLLKLLYSKSSKVCTIQFFSKLLRAHMRL
jgi:hypothetical protein